MHGHTNIKFCEINFGKKKIFLNGGIFNEWQESWKEAVIALIGTP